MYFVEIPYGATETEMSSLPNNNSIVYFTRNDYIAIPDDIIHTRLCTDSYLESILPEKITRFNGSIPTYKSVCWFREATENDIQLYSKDGTLVTNVGTDYLYFDIDTEDTLDSQVNAQRLIRWFNTIGIYKYDIYFSGSKGFHIAIDLTDVYGEFTLMTPNQIRLFVNTYVTKLSGVTLDQSIYFPRSILRLDNTMNIKTGLYKTKITEDELFADLGDIEINSTRPRDPFVSEPKQDSNYNFIKSLLTLAGDLVAYNLDTKATLHEISGTIEPIDYVEEYIAARTLKPGTRHEVSLVLSTYFRARGLSQQDAERELVEFMTHAVGSKTPVSQRIRESSNDVKTTYNNLVMFSKQKAMGVFL